MPQINLSVSYKKNTGLVISPQELLALYFYGIELRARDSSVLDNYNIETFIRAAQSEIERYFDFKIFKKLITERQDYYRDDYTSTNFPFVRTSLPVFKVHTLIGMVNGVEQIIYPENWLQEHTSSENRVYRQFAVVPNGSVVNADAAVIFTGVSAMYGLRSYPQIPNYWYIQYETGYLLNEVPQDITNLVGLMAAIQVFVLLGDLVLGGGVSSASIGIDGLSQSISTTKSANSGAYSGRINQYLKQTEATIQRLKRTYKGMSFAAL
jgi:hypothetical protein